MLLSTKIKTNKISKPTLFKEVCNTYWSITLQFAIVTWMVVEILLLGSICWFRLNAEDKAAMMSLWCSASKNSSGESADGRERVL